MDRFSAGYYQRLSLELLLMAMLSGCTLTPDTPPTLHTYLLAPRLSQHQQANSPSTELTLLVSAPQAAAGYNTRQMAYTRKPYELEYFSRNEWVAPPARMLEPLLVSALDASGHFQSVAPSDVRLLADLRLDTQIIRLVQDFSVQPSQGHIVLQARLIDLGSGQEIASRTFEARETAPKEGPYGGVVALNRALKHVLGELVTFITQAGLAP